MDYTAQMNVGGMEIRFIHSDIQPKGIALLVLHPDDYDDIIKKKYKQDEEAK